MSLGQGDEGGLTQLGGEGTGDRQAPAAPANLLLTKQEAPSPLLLPPSQPGAPP